VSSFDLSAFHIRNEKVAGVGPWLWLKADQWGWQQPAQEFGALAEVFAKHGNAANGDTIVCAGGSCGMYPRLWAEMFKTVYTFEPDPLSFHCLVVNCQSDRIIKINAALGAVPGMCEIKKGPEFNIGMHKVEVNGASRIPVMMLDHFRFNDLKAIQLDVEGFEPQVLRGAQQTIMTHLPLISVEGDVPESRDLLLSYGYREVARVGANPDVVFVANGKG
jgi:FkbM family methyltransferase